MYKFLLILMVLGTQFTLTACTIQRVPLTPFTDAERQTLGTIGIAAEVSRLETQYSRDPSIVDDGLRAMQDRLDDAGQRAIDGIKWGANRFPIGDHPECRIPDMPSNRSCLGGLFVAVLGKGVLMTTGGIAGGVLGAINRKTYSDPPLMELPERAVIRIVQESIDAVGLPEQLRDRVWERAQTYPAYHFERLSELPADPLKTQGEYHNREIEARYRPLREKGVQTLLKIRIPLVEFRGSEPEGSFQLFVHVETTLLRTDDQGCIRHRTWEFEGVSHRLDEWRKNDAKLLIDEFDRGLPLIAQRVTSTLFERPSWFSFGASTSVTLKSESLACRG
ncbi:MAG: hypothetical protein HOO98_03715 [Nitrospira sp.]|nr:hypothetical protein [Nitrospira sp.]